MTNTNSPIDFFSSISDPRVERTQKHSLDSILFISLCAVICGAEGWNEIEDYGNAKIDWLKKFLHLPNGIPSHDTFNRVISALDPKELKAEFDGEFLMAMAEKPNDILKCAMYLFAGYLDVAIQFAKGSGGGGSASDLPWARDPNEDDRRFSYRCMIQAHKMLKPSHAKRSTLSR